MDVFYYSSSIFFSYVKFYSSQAMNIIGVVSALAGAALVQVSLYLLEVLLFTNFLRSIISPWKAGNLLTVYSM